MHSAAHFQFTNCGCLPAPFLTEIFFYDTKSSSIGFRENRKVTSKIANSLGGYLSLVRGIRKRWKVTKRDELWFRAEDARYRKTHLQPGLYRPRESGKRKSIKNLLELENDLYEEFRRCAVQLSDARSSSHDWEWDSYYLMQHHGVPTRLLDWSDGALIALHFAIRDKPMPPKSGSIIYVLDPYWLIEILSKAPERKDMISRWKRLATNDHSVDEDEWDRLYLPGDSDDSRNPLLEAPVIPILFDSPHFTRRIAAQRSRFMIFGTDPLWIAQLYEQKASRLTSIAIPSGSVNRIRQELRDAGITESVVYPDLDGLGRELKQVWKTRR